MIIVALIGVQVLTLMKMMINMISIASVTTVLCVMYAKRFTKVLVRSYTSSYYSADLEHQLKTSIKFSHIELAP